MQTEYVKQGETEKFMSQQYRKLLKDIRDAADRMRKEQEAEKAKQTAGFHQKCSSGWGR